MQADTAITQEGASDAAKSASAAIDSMRSAVPRNQTERLPATPQPAAPANPATQTPPAKNHTAIHGVNFPATAAVADPRAAANHAVTRPSRHSRTRLATNPSKAPNAITPGTSVGRRYAEKLKAGFPKKYTSGMESRSRRAFSANVPPPRVNCTAVSAALRFINAVLRSTSRIVPTA